MITKNIKGNDKISHKKQWYNLRRDASYGSGKDRESMIVIDDYVYTYVCAQDMGDSNSVVKRDLL